MIVEGRCVTCGSPDLKSTRYCDRCLSRIKRDSDKSKNKLMAAGRCVSCKKLKGPDAAKYLCRLCANRANLRTRMRRLKKQYNLSLDEFQEMWAEQKGGCAICGNQEKSLVVDHDHATGHVRQLLCSTCNFGLGTFYDTPELLEKAAEYLRVHRKSLPELVAA